MYRNKYITIYKFFLLLFCLAQGPDLWAQKENAIWAYRENDGINFNTNPPSLFKSNMSKVGSATAVSDSTGNLLFYTNGINVWNRNHVKMAGAADVLFGPSHCNPSSYQTSLGSSIVRDPGNENRYYIFGTSGMKENNALGICDGFGQVRFSVVDMRLNGGLGDVEVAGRNTLLMHRSLPCITVGNGVCEKWVLAKKEYTDEVMAYRITTTGVDPMPVISNGVMERAGMLLSDNNKKIIIAGAKYKAEGTMQKADSPFYLSLYDFDVKTGKLSNRMVLDSIQHSEMRSILGIAFSPDASKLYAYEFWGGVARHLIFQYDLSQPSVHAIINSKTIVFENKKFTFNSGLHLAIDNKIYGRVYDTNTFIVINHPDLAPAFCDTRFVRVGGIINSHQTFSGWLHTPVPVSRVHYAYSDFNTCSFPATLKSLQPVADNYVWSTGATGPSLTVSQNGTYWVRAEQSCGAHRVDTFHVNFNPPQPIPDQHSCDGSPIQVPLDPQATYTWADGQGPTITKSGNYTVTISKPQCGSIQSTFKAIIYPPLGSPLLPQDTLICNPNMSADLSSYQELGSYEWSNGAITRGTTINTPGSYWLSSNSPCGLYTDTTNAAFCAPDIEDIISPDTACMGSCISFVPQTTNYPQQYEWTLEGGNPATYKGLSPGMVCYTNTGSYKVSLSVSSPGGTDKYEKQVLVLPRPIGRFADTPVTVTYETLLLLPACGEAANADWYKGDTLICGNCQTLKLEAKDWKTNIRCIISNADCKDTCGYNIIVSDIPTDVWFPTVFSPNGDGKNDLFRALTDNPNIQVMNLEVYHRWGGRVYRYTEDRRDGWDGTHNGIPQDMGAYAWIMRYKVLGNPNIFTLKGVVTLVR